MSTPTVFTFGNAPGVLPLAGHLWPLTRRPVEFLSSLSAYGDLVKVRLGPTEAYVPCHPELVRQVLVDDRTFDKGGPFYDKSRELFGNNIGSCVHKDHRQQRRLMQPAFHKARLESYAAVMEQQITNLTGTWLDGQSVDAFPVLNALALRTVIRTVVSSHVDDDTVKGIQHAFETLTHGIFPWLFLPKALQGLPLPALRRTQEAMSYLRGTMNPIIAAYRRAGVDHGDLLSMLVTARKNDGSGLDDVELQDQVMTLLLAGSETVGSTVTWALCLLAQHPTVQRRLQEEVDAVLGDRPASWHDLSALGYANRVIMESLRVETPTWLFTRTVTAPVELGGVHLPAGTIVLFVAAATHHNSDVYPRAAEFDPDRWLPEPRSAMPRGSFVAFGGGFRKCIGDVYAMAESTLILASIVSRWHLELAPDADLRPKALSAVHYPRRPLLRVTRRTVRSPQEVPR